MKIGFAADLHYGYTCLGYLNPATGINTHLEDTHRCFYEFVKECIAQRVSNIVIAGDIYDRRNPNEMSEFYFGQSLSLGIANGIQFDIVLGNHDFYKESSALALLQGIQSNQIRIWDKPNVFNLSDDVQITAIPWPGLTGATPEQFTEHIQKLVPDIPVDPDTRRILVGHLPMMTAKIGSYQMTGLEPGITDPEMFSRGYFDVALLGHYHRQQRISENTWYVGSINRCDFGEEKEHKSGLIYDTETEEMFIVRLPATKICTVDTTPETYKQDIDVRAGELTGAVVRVRMKATSASVAPPLSAIKEYLDHWEIRYLRSYDLDIEQREETQRAIGDLRIDPLEALKTYLESSTDLDEDEIIMAMAEGEDIVRKVA